MNTVVRIENLVKRYKELVAVDHMNLSIEKGEVFGLLGPNGSGKSTIINCLLSLTQFDKGEIFVFGEKMRADNYSVKGRIGVVLQNVAVFDELTVYENIDYFCSLYVKDKAKRKELVKEAIAFVGLEEFVKFYPKKLSGGLLRRLNIGYQRIVVRSKIRHRSDACVVEDIASCSAFICGIECEGTGIPQAVDNFVNQELGSNS